MDVRKYGKPPFKIAVLHGGPGAPGYMAPVARELSKTVGVLEPLQSKDSLEGQVEELKEQLLHHADFPVTLVGSSWGAVLALLTAPKDEVDIDKLILIGSAVFDADSSSKIESIRLSRLTEKERKRYELIQRKLDGAPADKRKELMKEWSGFFNKTDMYDPQTTDLETIEVQFEIFSRVWSDFVIYRDNPGFLKNEISKLNIPVVVIHGDYDPHPIDGIRPFLEDCLENISFHILPECGHYPWIEKRARKQFFEILHEEI